jgi:DNA-binding Lrp family transcriptional regulator
MDELDRRIVNALQSGFPLSPRPFDEAARALGIDEGLLLSKLKAMLAAGVLTRFGPLFDPEKLGGAVTLCAMSVPAADFERVATQVNAHPEVAHNYERAHRYNMWFVLTGSDPAAIGRSVVQITRETGYPVLELPKEAEYFLELRLVA